MASSETSEPNVKSRRPAGKTVTPGVLVLSILLVYVIVTKFFL